MTFVNTCFSPSNFISVGLLSLKVRKGHRSIGKHFMHSRHPVYVIEREENSGSREAFHCRDRNMYPLSAYYVHSSARSASDKVPVLGGFQTLPGERT